MTSVLLDTHAWIWLAAGDRRIARHERLLQHAAESSCLLLSSVSIYEAALIGHETERGERRGRQAVKMRPTVESWIRDSVQGTRTVVVPLDPDTALAAASYSGMHGDPIDRVIVAAASTASARLVTADTKIIAFARKAGIELLEL